MKRCIPQWCGKLKPISEFHKDPGTCDGLRTMCKVCISKKHKKWSIENKGKRKISTARARMNNILTFPEKWCASSAASNARTCGEIIATPCEKCGEEKVVGHHDSYKKKHWLRVRWLCTTCHDKWHTKYVYNPKTKKFDRRR